MDDVEERVKQKQKT